VTAEKARAFAHQLGAAVQVSQTVPDASVLRARPRGMAAELATSAVRWV